MSNRRHLVLADRAEVARFATAAEADACVARLRQLGRYVVVGTIDLARR